LKSGFISMIAKRFPKYFAHLKFLLWCLSLGFPNPIFLRWNNILLGQSPTHTKIF